MKNFKIFSGTFLATTLGLTCPVCWPAAGAFLASVGLGFAVSLKVVIPLLVIFLIIAWWGMYVSYKTNHHHIAPLIVSIVGGVFIPAGRYLFGSLILTYIAIGVFVIATIWNYNLLIKCKK